MVSLKKESVLHPYMKMFDAEILREFLGKSWVVFSVFFGLYYLLQFGLALMCANFYSQSYPLRLQEWKYIPVDPTKTDIVAKTNEPLRVCGLEGIEDWCLLGGRARVGHGVNTLLYDLQSRE